MKKTLTITVLLLTAMLMPCKMYGQQPAKGFDLNFLAGMNIGATTPVPVPGALDIKRYNPKFNPRLGAGLTYFFNSNWGVGAALTLEWRGMKVHTQVSDVHLAIDVPNLGTLTGYVTGKNTTKVRSVYLTQPIYGVYRFNNPKWQVRGGIYFAESLHHKFKGDVSNVEITVESPLSQQRQIPYATLDYSDDARKFEIGAIAGGEFRMNRHIGFFADFTWGFTPYFSGEVPIHFVIRNIYLSLGVTFRL